MLRSVLFYIVFLIVPAAPVQAQSFKILAWNVESNRPGSEPVSDSTVIGNELREMLESEKTRASLIALSEVEPRAVLGLVNAAMKGIGSEVDFVTSASGGYRDADTLMLIVDSTQFEIRDSFEIHRYAGIVGNIVVDDPENFEVGTVRARSPLAVKLRRKSDTLEFWLIVNHLARGEAELRTQQAMMLRQWAADRNEPIVAAGDFNFDYDFSTGEGNDGFRAMLEGDVWEWLKPDPLIDTNWSDDRYATDGRVDRYPDSMLDFVFVANSAKRWNGVCDVIVRDGDFPDSDLTSDHRPILATLSPVPTSE